MRRVPWVLVGITALGLLLVAAAVVMSNRIKAEPQLRHETASTPPRDEGRRAGPGMAPDLIGNPGDEPTTEVSSHRNDVHSPPASERNDLDDPVHGPSGNSAATGTSPSSPERRKLRKRGSDIEIMKSMMNSDYNSYDKDTLVALAKDGDVVALHKLWDKVTPRELCDLAEPSYRKGYALAYLVLMDTVLEHTKDKTLARAYFYVARQAGSDWAQSIEPDSLRRTATTPEENLRALALAEQLKIRNDCDWAPDK